MESYLFSFQMMHKSQFNKTDRYDCIHPVVVMCSRTHTHHESSDETLVRDRAVASLAPGSADEVSLRSSQSRCGVGRGVKRVYRRGWRSGARKAKAKWWTNVKHRCAAVSSVSSAASMQPDLEQVDGVLFVSFTAKV